MFLIQNFTTKNRFGSSRVPMVVTHTEPMGNSVRYGSGIIFLYRTEPI